MDNVTPRPRVSALVTSYNYGRFITEALESIFAQTDVDFEIVLVDNGSTDDTLARIAPYRSDPRLRVFINETNLGTTGNHNRAFEHSRGDFVVWLSADDRFLPGAFSRALRWYTEHPEIDVIYTDALFCSEAGNVFGPRASVGHPSFAYSGGRPEFADLLSIGCYISWPTMLFRRELIEELGPMDAAYTGSDYEYVARIAAAGKSFGFRPAPSAIIRAHAAQQTGVAWHDAGHAHTELLRMIDRYVQPRYYHLLRGRRGLFAAALQAKFDLADGMHNDLRERIRAATTITLNEPVERVTVLMHATGHLGLLERSLLSLKAQTFVAYDVVIASPYAFDIADYVRLVLGHDRVQVFADPSTTYLALRRRAMDLVGGDAIAYLREGNMFRPNHLEVAVDRLRKGFNVAIATATGRTESSETSKYWPLTDLSIDEAVYNDGSRPLGVANDVPIDALVHRREVWDYTDHIRPGAGPGAEWEYVLRVVLAGGQVWTGVRTVDIGSIRHFVSLEHIDMQKWYLGMLRQFYDALPINEEHAPLRLRFHERLTDLFARDAPDQDDREAIARWQRELSGATLYETDSVSPR